MIYLLTIFFITNPNNESKQNSQTNFYLLNLINTCNNFIVICILGIDDNGMYMYIHVEPIMININMTAGIKIVDHLLVAFYLYMYMILYVY